MFEKIDKLINVSASNYGLQKQSKAARICFEAGRLYNHLFKPISFKNGVLKVLVDNDIEAAEIRFKSHEIIKNINSKLNNDIIKKIRFEIN